MPPSRFSLTIAAMVSVVLEVIVALKFFNGLVNRDARLDLVYPLLALLIAPAIWLVVWNTACKREQRVKDGLCSKCGYDLRAHRKVQRCPECGELN